MYVPKKESEAPRVFRSQKKLFAYVLALLLLTVFMIGSSPAQGQPTSEPLVYTVKPGDYLIKIGVNYGSPNFWIEIYEANIDQIEDPDLIYPDQKFVIPSSVTNSAKFTGNYGGRTDSLDTQARLAEFRNVLPKLSTPNYSAISTAA